MKSIFTSLSVMIAVAALGLLSAAEDAKSAKSLTPAAGFEKLKSLKGDWEVIHAHDAHGKHDGVINYKIAAAGSAVVETTFGGTENEMITMFYLDGEELALTHYCMLQNRPHMRAEKQTNPNQIVFKCKQGADPKLDAEDHMHQATFTFTDADHVRAEWVLFKGGKADSTHAMELARKKK